MIVIASPVFRNLAFVVCSWRFYECVTSLSLRHVHWWILLSISSTFYVQIFCTNIVRQLFSIYVLALGRNSYKKFARKTLMKLTTVVNFTAILRAAFAMIIFCQKSTKPNCYERKAAQSTFIKRIIELNCKQWKAVQNTFVQTNWLLKCWWNWHLLSILTTFKSSLLHQFPLNKKL